MNLLDLSEMGRINEAIKFLRGAAPPSPGSAVPMPVFNLCPAGPLEFNLPVMCVLEVQLFRSLFGHLFSRLTGGTKAVAVLVWREW